MTAQEYKAPSSVGRLQQRAFIVGVIALLVAIFGWIKSPELFYHSYLTSYMLVLGIALGSLGLLMLQHLTSGYWGIAIRRPLEAATRTLPLLLLLFVPLLFGVKTLYFRWLEPSPNKEEALSSFQQSYLTLHGFYIRAAIYFAVWLLLMFAFNSWSRQQDIRQQDRALRRRLKFLSGPGIILYVFGITFAAIDWVMSIQPHWASTIYGFIYVAGELISSMALMIIIVVMLSRTEPYARVVTQRVLHDLGKLLFAFLLLWAYFDFSQLLIVWSGNLPEEISFYRTRLTGGWGALAVAILVFHFFVPFFLLLSRGLKRDSKLIPKVAAWMIFMRLVDLFWFTRPDLPGAHLAWLDFVLPIALFGIWLGFFAWHLQRQPILPLGEPKLAEVLAQHEH